MSQRPVLLLAALSILLAAAPAAARTARSLADRIHIDGFTSDFADSEWVFGVNAGLGALEEATDDSRWGVNDDLNQIRITWDAKYLYLAGEGRIWDNNMILFIDSTPYRGLARMDSLNSWRRNFQFDTTGFSQGGGFAPDLFGATWDTNTSPRLIMQRLGQQVDDFTVDTRFFSAAATFDKANAGRAMELAIPWRTVFLSPEGLGTRDTVMTVAGVTDTFQLFPPGAKLKICGVITGGADGTGGPDSAPDNTRGHTADASAAVYIDNYAIVDLDRNDDTGRGHGGPDGVADWDVDPRSRITFRFPPPISLLGLNQVLANLRFDRPAFAPDRGERIRFTFDLTPRPDPLDPISVLRTFNLTANVFDLRGRFVKNVYVGQTRPMLNPTDAAADLWDGRDQGGALVPPGVYVMRVILEPNLSRVTRAFVVVR